VQHVNGPLLWVSFVDAFANVDGNARHNTGHRTSPLTFDKPVDVTAQQADHLVVAAHDISESCGLLGSAVTADVVVVDVERRMVNEQE